MLPVSSATNHPRLNCHHVQVDLPQLARVRNPPSRAPVQTKPVLLLLSFITPQHLLCHSTPSAAASTTSPDPLLLPALLLDPNCNCCLLLQHNCSH
jgi:hypothetical protein